MNNLDRQLKRIDNIRDQARDSVEYKIESAKIDYSEQISERLETLGLTQIELAKRMGVSAPYVTKLLRGTANLTLDSMVKIAHVLECDFALEVRPCKRTATTGHSPAGPPSAKPIKKSLQRTKRPVRAMVHESPASYGRKKNA